MLRQLLGSTGSNDNPVGQPPVDMNDTMERKVEGLSWLGFARVLFLPFLIRRGGATAYIRATRNMEATLDRGRWSSPGVAQIYVNDGLAREIESNFIEAEEERLVLMVRAFHRWLPE